MAYPKIYCITNIQSEKLEKLKVRLGLSKSFLGYIKDELLNIFKIYWNVDKYDEDKYTEMYMEKYGIENVRGGSYSKIILEESCINVLNKKSIIPAHEDEETEDVL